jgi:hypothetical protein
VLGRTQIILDALNTATQTVGVTPSHPSCQWTPAASAPFITIQSVTATNFTFALQQNTSTERRRGTITVGTATVDVLQTEAVGFPTPAADNLFLIGAVPVSSPGGPFAGSLSNSRVGVVITMRYELATRESALVCALVRLNSADGNPPGTCLPQLIYRGTGAKAVVVAVNGDVPLPIDTNSVTLYMGTTSTLPRPFLVEKSEALRLTWSPLP